MWSKAVFFPCNIYSNSDRLFSPSRNGSALGQVTSTDIYKNPKAYNKVSRN